MTVHFSDPAVDKHFQIALWCKKGTRPQLKMSEKKTFERQENKNFTSDKVLEAKCKEMSGFSILWTVLNYFKNDNGDL